MKISRKAVEKRWVKYDQDENVEFLLRPFPFSKDTGSVAIETLWLQFDHCLVEWKGLEWEDDEPFEVNEENKRYLFDYSDDVKRFIFDQAREMRDEVVSELGNSPKSQSGSQTPNGAAPSAGSIGEKEESSRPATQNATDQQP